MGSKTCFCGFRQGGETGGSPLDGLYGVGRGGCKLCVLAGLQLREDVKEDSAEHLSTIDPAKSVLFSLFAWNSTRMHWPW